MSLFVEDEASDRIWKQSWRLIWPKDDYLEKLLDQGLTPVLGGYSLLAQAIDESDETEVDYTKADELKAGDAKVDNVKADELKAEDIKVDTKAEDTKADEPNVDEPKADEPKAGEPKADKPKAEDTKADEPNADEPKADEPKAGEPKADKPKAEDTKADEPNADEPKADEPKAEETKADGPHADGSQADEPKADEPNVNKPKADESKTDKAKADDPKVGEGEGESFNFVFGVVKSKPDLPEKLGDILGENFFQDFKESLPSDAIFNDAETKVTIPSTKTSVYFGLHDGQFWPKEVEDIGYFARSVEKLQTTAVIFYSDPSRALHTCVEGDDNMLVFPGGFAAVLPDGVGVNKEAWCVSEPHKD